jgi:ribose/xylose/arabinose/galactoside ABC-type transport system permease subunit
MRNTTTSDLNKSSNKKTNFLSSESIKSIFSKYGIFIAFLVLVLIISMLTDRFFTVNNLLNVIRQVSFNGILAIGLTFVIITGGIDLSVGSVVAISAVVSASFAVDGKASVPMLVAIIIGLLVGILCGFINGFLITKGKLAPFIVTMGMMTIARGASLVYTSGRPITSLTESYQQIGSGYLFGIPVPIYIFLLVVVISYFLLNFTTFGRHVYAVGGNEKAAKASGLNTYRIKTMVYIISGILAALVGMVLSARVNSASPIWGEGYELDAIAAAVIGGTSLSGGIGNILGTVVGALIIGIISNGLDIMNVSPYFQQIIKGLIIVVAVLIDRKGKQNE